MSSRKRNSDQGSTEIETEAETTGTTAIADGPEAEANKEGTSFAERVGQKKRATFPDPFGVATDRVAGVKLFESRRDRQMAIMFGEGRSEDRPSQSVIDMLKGSGYRWKPADRIWAHPIPYDRARTTRIEAKRLYDDICATIRQDKGVEANPDLPF